MNASYDIPHLLLEYRYWIILPLAFLEGPLVAFVVGALAARDLFDIGVAFALLMLGDIVPDVACYLIGRRAAQSSAFARWMKRYQHAARTAEIGTALWHEHGVKTMVFSKLSYGLSIPLLTSAGLTGLPFWRFASYAVPVAALQYATFLTLGYYLGSHIKAIESIWQYAGIMAAAVLVLIILHVVVGSWLNRRVTSMPDREAQP